MQQLVRQRQCRGGPRTCRFCITQLLSSSESVQAVRFFQGNSWRGVLSFRKEKAQLFTTNRPLLVQNKTIKLTNRPTLSYGVVIASVHWLRLVNR